MSCRCLLAMKKHAEYVVGHSTTLLVIVSFEMLSRDDHTIFNHGLTDIYIRYFPEACDQTKYISGEYNIRRTGTLHEYYFDIYI